MIDTSAIKRGSENFQLFRGDEAPPLRDGIAGQSEDVPEVIREGSTRFMAAGGREAYSSKYLFGIPTMSLGLASFKKGCPILLHSHDANCVYYIVSGSIQIGAEILKAGDGFFVGRDVPYTYTAGDEGADILEFRDTDTFKTSFTSKNPAYWDKVVKTMEKCRQSW